MGHGFNKCELEDEADGFSEDSSDRLGYLRCSIAYATLGGCSRDTHSPVADEPGVRPVKANVDFIRRHLYLQQRVQV
jgi:hypothetical protein